MPAYDVLISAAKSASDNAYAPYSAFKVGCAVLADSGRVYTGVNVENSAFGSTICAERVALGAAITAGERRISAIAIYNKDSAPVPCGACLQVISELAADAIIIAVSEDDRKEFAVSQLLPCAFSESKRLTR